MAALIETDRLFYGQTELDAARTERLVSDALTGMDDGELYLESGQFESFSWDDGKLKAAHYDASQGFGLRAVSGETVGFSYASTLTEESLRRAAETVRAVKGGYEGSLALPPRGTNAQLYSPDNPLPTKSFEEKLALLQNIDSYIRAQDSAVHQVSVSLAAGWKAFQIVRAGGWRGADIRPIVALTVSVVTKRGERLEVGSSGAGGRYAYDRLFDPANWHEIANEALRKARVNLDAIDSPAGEMTVVLGPGWPAVLLHEAIGHGLEGDFHRKKTSAFSGLMGQRVAAQGVTVVDDGTIPDVRGSITIDDEGTPSQRTTLIEDGVLVGLMQDRMNARLMGVQSTGNGRRQNFACQPYPRMTNTMMLAGDKTPEEVIASVKRGVYAADFGGGQVDITSGKFVFSATEAYEIVDGKIGCPLRGASLVGTGFEALQHITMVGNNPALDKGIGTCGKEGQSIAVGVGQPTLRLDNMTVGGSAV